MQVRVHWGVNSVPPEKIPVMPTSAILVPAIFERQRQRFEQLRRGEHALDVMAGGEDCDRLIDTMFLVFFQVLHPAFFDQLHDPAGIEVDAEADAVPMLGQVLNRQSQTAGAAGAKH